MTGLNQSQDRLELLEERIGPYMLEWGMCLRNHMVRGSHYITVGETEIPGAGKSCLPQIMLSSTPVPYLVITCPSPKLPGQEKAGQGTKASDTSPYLA